MKRSLSSLTMNNAFLDFFEIIGGFSKLFGRSCRELMSRPFYGGLVVEQVYLTGVRTLPLALITALSIGMVMALQFGIGLEKFGGRLYVPRIVSVSIIRELGPAFTSIMMAARVSSGIASEVGSMKVTQQLDAIRALGTSPIKKIVIPRILGVVIALPLLTVIADIVGVGGALIVSWAELGLDPVYYYKFLIATLDIKDFYSGLIKTFFFALFVGLSGCYYGMKTGNGTKAVGSATTKAVVTASVLIFLSDYFLTKGLAVVEEWL